MFNRYIKTKKYKIGIKYLQKKLKYLMLATLLCLLFLYTKYLLSSTLDFNVFSLKFWNIYL